jgi:putative nucleotidyltransferase with HDIG domain
MKMMDHIVVHSLQVCQVASFLTQQLIQQNYRLNFELIQAAALLHDITKTRSFKTRENHAQTGGEYLTDCGYPEIGDLVRQHVRLDNYSATAQLTDAEVLNYADKRVLHDEIVGLDRRLDYILERYAETAEHQERIYQLWQKTRDMETKIFNKLAFTPGDLTRLIPHNGYAAELHEYQKVYIQI